MQSLPSASARDNKRFVFTYGRGLDATRKFVSAYLKYVPMQDGMLRSIAPTCPPCKAGNTGKRLNRAQARTGI